MTAQTKFLSKYSTTEKVVFSSIALLVLGILGTLGYLIFSNREIPTETPKTPPATSSYVAPKTPVADEGSIEIWSWNTAAKALRDLVPAFNKIYPNITVVVKEIPYNEANDKFRLTFTTGNVNVPDIWDTEGPVTNEYIKAGALLDITDKAKKYMDDFVAYKWTEVMNNNKIYALPWDTAPVGMFYRRDLFTQAGIDPATINTWDDFIAAGKKYQTAMNPIGKTDKYIFFMSRKADVQDMYQILLSQYSGSLFDEKGNPTFNTPQGLAAMALMKKISDSGINAEIGWWTPEFYAAIKNGTIAALPQGVWMGGQIKEIAPDLTGKWGVFPLPAVEAGGVRSAVRGGSNLAIPAKAKNPDAAWKFIEFALANKESQLAMYKAYNIFPALKACYNDPVFNEPMPYFNNQKTSQLFIKAQDEIPLTFHYGQYHIQTTTLLSKEIVQYLNGTITAEQALADLLKAYNAKNLK